MELYLFSSTFSCLIKLIFEIMLNGSCILRKTTTTTNEVDIKLSEEIHSSILKFCVVQCLLLSFRTRNLDF